MSKVDLCLLQVSFSRPVTLSMAAFRISSETTALRNMMPNSSFVPLIRVTRGQTVKRTGMVLCNFIYDMQSCVPVANPWNGVT